MIDIDFSLDEALKSNSLITGTNASGKSRLASAIASSLNHLGHQIICFDNSGVWKRISDLPFVFTVPTEPIIQGLNGNILLPLPMKSTIYDMSLLIPNEQQSFVDMFCRLLWNFRIQNPEWQQKLWLIFEECHLYLRTMRTQVAQNLMRIATVGRNINTRIIGISPDLALIDPAFIRLCQQRYHGKLGIEENSKRKFRSYYGKDYTRIACEGLQTGDFLYVLNNRIKVISIPLFKPHRLPHPTIIKTETKGFFRKTTIYTYTTQ